MDLDAETIAELGLVSPWARTEEVLFDWRRRKASRDLPRLLRWLKTEEGKKAKQKHEKRKRSAASLTAKGKRRWARIKADPEKLAARRKQQAAYQKLYRKRKP